MVISSKQLGFILAVGNVCYVFAGFVLGPVGDALGGRTTYVLCQTLAALLSGLQGFSVGPVSFGLCWGAELLPTGGAVDRLSKDCRQLV